MVEYKISTKPYEMNSTDRYVIGIDPGTHMGFAIYNCELQRYVFCTTYTFWECASRLSELPNKIQEEHIRHKVVIEDIIGNKPTFQKGMILQAIKTQNIQRIMQSIGIFDKLAQDVGGNKRDETHLLELLETKNIDIIKYVPKKKSQTKITQKELTAQTGIISRTSQHVRDAIMLVERYIKESSNI